MNLKPNNKSRKKDYFRFQRERSIKRKTKILREVNDIEYSENNYVGKLSKGKIHCSCFVCKYGKRMKIEKKKHSLDKSLLDFQ